MAAEHVELLVIGAGQGGDPVARAFAEAGKSTILVEREHVGGTCVNTGCTPTKTMAASARAAYTARRAGEFGVHVGSVHVNMKEVRARKQAVVDDFRGGTEKHLQSTQHLDLVYGDAKFTGPRTVEIALRGGGTRTVSAEIVVINTGARSAVPKIDGLQNVPFLDHASIEELTEWPPHLLVLGGSYIALEFGQMFRRFGSEVTIINKSADILEREDDDIVKAMCGILREDGIKVLLNAQTVKAEKSADGVTLTVNMPEGTKTVTGSHLLLAVGRTPNTEGLGLDAAGVHCDEHGFIVSNDRLETSAPGVYVIGDMKGGPQFTHISYDDFRILKVNLLDGGARSTKDRLVPYTVFTDPQLGRVGLTEAEARKMGHNVKVATLPASETARGIETGETRGLLKAVVDADTGQILGCAILSYEGGEVMAVLQMAMLGRVPYTTIRDGVFAHPTLSESLNNLFMGMA